MRGDELLALGAVVDGGMGSDSEFAFDFCVGVDDELEFIRILVAVQ